MEMKPDHSAASIIDHSTTVSCVKKKKTSLARCVQLHEQKFQLFSGGKVELVKPAL